MVRMRAGFCVGRALYRAAMLRRLLALFALVTGLAATATPVEAAWKSGEQASVIASAFSGAGQTDQHQKAEIAALGQPLAGRVAARVPVVAEVPFVNASVVLRVDRALE